MVGGSMEGLLNGSAGQNVNISLWNSIWRLQRLTKWLKRTIKYRKERLCLFQSGCASMKEKKRARGAFHMSMPGGSDVSLSIHGLQQHAKRRRKVTTKGEKEEETATEQTRMLTRHLHIAKICSAKGGKCSRCICQNSRTTRWVFMSYIRSEHILFVYTETLTENVRGSAFITLKKSCNWVLQWIGFPLLSKQINFKCLFT